MSLFKFALCKHYFVFKYNITSLYFLLFLKLLNFATKLNFFYILKVVKEFHTKFYFPLSITRVLYLFEIFLQFWTTFIFKRFIKLFPNKIKDILFHCKGYKHIALINIFNIKQNNTVMQEHFILFSKFDYAILKLDYRWSVE